MSWAIVTKTEAANFARVTEPQLQDVWYDAALALIENYTGWHSLEVPKTASEYVDGNGSQILHPNLPVNSVNLIQIHGQTVPSAYYHVNWYGVEMRTYIPGDVYISHMLFERKLGAQNIFPYGIKNIYIEYSYGGTSSMPKRLVDNIKWGLLQIIKEISTVPKNEGSDSMLKKYRPDRTLLPEEVLSNYGLHGKIRGILMATFPKQKLWS